MKNMFILSLGSAVLLAVTGSASGQNPNAEKGMKVFVAQKCTTCHSIAGKGNKKGSLDEVGDKLTAAQIRQWIADPVGTAAATTPPPTRKPAMKKKDIPAGDVDALVALLSSLKAK
jgi:mono/diheme cytochrome c family protein